jgi:hypothetical protein
LELGTLQNRQQAIEIKRLRFLRYYTTVAANGQPKKPQTSSRICSNKRSVGGRADVAIRYFTFTVFLPD